MARVTRPVTAGPISAQPPKADDGPGDDRQPVHQCPRCGFAGEMQALAPPPVDGKAAREFRVRKGGTFMWNGAVCNVATGDLVRLAHYGAAGLANMRGRGIVLEPVG